MALRRKHELLPILIIQDDAHGHLVFVDNSSYTMYSFLLTLLKQFYPCYFQYPLSCFQFIQEFLKFKVIKFRKFGCFYEILHLKIVDVHL